MSSILTNDDDSESSEQERFGADTVNAFKHVIES